MVKHVLSALLALGLIIGVAGCNTVQGVGKDVSSAGRALERSSGK